MVKKIYNNRLVSNSSIKNRRYTIAVIGSTGQLGRSALEMFVSRGHRVLACSRAEQKDLPVGAQGRIVDVTRPETLRPVLEQADIVHLSLSGGNNSDHIWSVEDEGVRHIVSIAEELGIERISMISGMYAKPEFANHPSEGAKVRAEGYLLDANLPVTIFRPAFFAETLENFVQNGRGMLLGSQPHTVRPIISADLMGNIERSYTMPEAQDRIFEVTGREPMTLKTALRRYLDVTAPGAKISTMPLWLMSPINRLFMKGKLTRALGTMELMQKHGEIADPTAYFEVFGTQVTSFESWLGQRSRNTNQ